MNSNIKKQEWMNSKIYNQGWIWNEKWIWIEIWSFKNNFTIKMKDWYLNEIFKEKYNEF